MVQHYPPRLRGTLPRRRPAAAAGARALSGLCLLSILGCAGSAATEPAFPWTTLTAVARESPHRDLGQCQPRNSRSSVVAFLMSRPQGFYRLYVMLHGPRWIALHYDEDAVPDRVWYGTWSGDHLLVTSASPYDPIAHASACDALFDHHP